jgi:nucleoside phosphorylase
MSGKNIDFVIITALTEERDAILNKLTSYTKLPPTEDDIRVYFSADLPATFSDGSTCTYSVILLCLLGMGRVEAANATKDAIHRWKPRYIILVGIAGGFVGNDATLGDILISEQIVDYELQKLRVDKVDGTDNYRPKDSIRYSIHRAEPRLLGAAQNIIGNDWTNGIDEKRPKKGNIKTLFGPIATGDKVDCRGDLWKKNTDAWPKLIGIEMEAGGAASAAFQSANSPGFFMIRSVSDLADADKETANVKKWRKYACDVAASYTIALLQSGPVPTVTSGAGIKASIGIKVNRKPDISPTVAPYNEIPQYAYCTVYDAVAFLGNINTSLINLIGIENIKRTIEDVANDVTTQLKRQGHDTISNAHQSRLVAKINAQLASNRLIAQFGKHLSPKSSQVLKAVQEFNNNDFQMLTYGKLYPAWGAESSSSGFKLPLPIVRPYSLSLSFSGQGVNDLSVKGDYTKNQNTTYEITIDSVNTFKWRCDDQAFTNGVSLSETDQVLSDGLIIKFNSTTQHHVGDTWIINVKVYGRAEDVRARVPMLTLSDDTYPQLSAIEGALDKAAALVYTLAFTQGYPLVNLKDRQASKYGEIMAAGVAVQVLQAFSLQEQVGQLGSDLKYWIEEYQSLISNLQIDRYLEIFQDRD